MAERPVFISLKKYPWFQAVPVTFHYAAGFALVQRQKNICAIHEAYEKEYPGSTVLEASSKAPTELGKALSPFYLELNGIPVECVFQASKVFQNGGPYTFLLQESGIKAKTSGYLKNSGALLYYKYENEKCPVIPQGWFYMWLYLQALCQHPQLTDQLTPYTGFTDIAFNPKTGHACQAMALAVYKALEQKDILQEAMKDWHSFLKIVYKTTV